MQQRKLPGERPAKAKLRDARAGVAQPALKLELAGGQVG